MKKLTTLLLLTILLGSCMAFPSGEEAATPVRITAEMSTMVAETAGQSPTLAPVTPIPTFAPGASAAELKYRVLEEFPDFFFCDPDFYPVARGDETTRAQERFPEIQAGQEEFQAILGHLGLSGATTFTEDQKLEIYREHKKLNAIHFDAAGDAYQFQIKTGQEGLEGSIITGLIDAGGSIEILQQDSGVITCPICLAAGTLIDTPRGPVRVEELRVGDLVWTQDEAGRRVSAPILKTGNMDVPDSYQMMQLLLEDGRGLLASSGHPTAHGLRLGDLQIGDRLDGAQVIHIEYVPYRARYTYDILPAGATGFYWANEIMIGSTLAGP